METNTEAYKQHLENKYLPGRDRYLRWFFFPKILKQFNDGEVLDLGFGTGEFLKFLKSKGRPCSGIDSNPFLIDMLVKQGFDVRQDDITRLDTVSKPVKNAVSDNVLEHLDLQQIDAVFSCLKRKMEKNSVWVVIVPLEKGYRRDPTHKTFVNRSTIEQMCRKYEVKLKKGFYHPVNICGVGKFFYLNMQVYTVQF